MSIESWKFRPISWRVYDGDTVLDLVLDLGFNIQISIKTRLQGINAPEMHGESRDEGIASRNYLRVVLDQAQRANQLQVQTNQRQGKYGRWLITFWDGKVNLNKRMVEDGFAVFQEY